MRRYVYRRTTLLTVACVGFLAGIGLAQSTIAMPSALLLVSFAACTLTARRKSHLTLMCVVLLSVCAGYYRGQLYAQKLAAYALLYNQAISFQAIVKGDAVYGKQSQLTFDVSGVRVRNGQSLTGKIGVSGFGENMVYQGDEVQVSGKLRAGKGSYQGFMSFAQVHMVRHHDTLVNALRRKFAAGLTSVLPEPLAPFGMGLLIGQRNTLPPAVSQTLLWVGLTHIIAVSGYNLTILMRATRKLLARGSKYQIFIISNALIGTFLLFSGTSPSIVRAAIVSVLNLVAWYYGREWKPVLLILLVAAGTAYANPGYVWSDSGWYLSFLAFFGVVVVAPLFHHRLPSWLSESLIGAMIIESVCAEAMTMPYVLHIFGQTSFVSLPANMIIASFVPVAMLVTLIAGLAGMWLGAFAGWLAWPAQIVLNYMLDMCALLSRIPHVFVDQLFLSLAGMVLWYVALMIVSVTLWRRQRKNAIITDSTQAKTERSFSDERTLKMVYH